MSESAPKFKVGDRVNVAYGARYVLGASRAAGKRDAEVVESRDSDGDYRVQYGTRSHAYVAETYLTLVPKPEPEPEPGTIPPDLALVALGAWIAYNLNLQENAK